MMPTKHYILKEWSQKLVDIGVQADANAEARARQLRYELNAALSNNHTRCNQKKLRNQKIRSTRNAKFSST
ncbi:MAG: hypothetical protein G5663_01975 [Serratia symbiotica]|nr:hypothetical protein [Serratia symbiotica]